MLLKAFSGRPTDEKVGEERTSGGWICVGRYGGMKRRAWMRVGSGYRLTII